MTSPVLLSRNLPHARWNYTTSLAFTAKMHVVSPRSVTPISRFARVNSWPSWAPVVPANPLCSILRAGVDVPTQGHVLVEGRGSGHTVSGLRAAIRRKSIGYVFQDFNLLPSLSAAENVSFPLELDGWNPRKAREAAMPSLNEVGVADMADRRPEDMSGGQAQRVAIARALVGPRRLLLADEPTGALDSNAGMTILEVLRTRADRGAAVLLVTHETRFAAWADRTAFLKDGRIIDETGSSNMDDLLNLEERGA